MRIIEENMLNDQTNNEQLPVKKARDHSGVRNPHYNHPHSDKAKAAISSRQKARYEMLRQIVNQKTLTEDRVREIIKETVADYIKNNATPVNNNKTIDIRL